MAYTLKTTGIATKLVACIAVDEDGTTVKDFVSGNTGTYNASIGAPKTGTATWKGVTRNWFKTDYGADQYAPQGWAWTSTEAMNLNSGNGVSFFGAVNALTDAADGNILWLTADNNNGMRITTGSKLEVLMGATQRGVGTTTLTTATKLSFGFNQKYNTNSLPMFYGLESGSLAADGTYNEGGYASDSSLSMVGGHSGYGSCRGQYFVLAFFSDATLLTTAEMQSLHDDWFGTLFESPITGTFEATTGAATMAASGTHITPITGDFAGTTGATVMAATGTVNVPPKQLIFSSGAGNLIKDASQNLVTASTVAFAWYDSTTVTALGAAKDVGTFNIVAGVATITLSNTSLVAGQTGTLLMKLNSAKSYVEMTIT